MSVFDYAGWTGRAFEFTRALGSRAGAEVRVCDLGPPLPAGEADHLERALRRRLPTALRDLLERGSGALDCAYTFKPEPEGRQRDRFTVLFPHQTHIYGGARFIAADLPELARSCAEWVQETWISEDADERALWQGALPVAGLENGDFVALDIRAAAEDPPVVYLAHDDESVTLAPSLTTFLAAWETLCYLGPELWLLDRFRAANGFLDGGDPKAAELRALLAPRQADR